MTPKFRLTKQVRLLQTVIVVIAIITACKSESGQAWPTEDVEDPSSRLLATLITKSDFVGEWSWSDIFTYQNKETPTLDNDQLVENAARSLTGRYGNEKVYIDVRHGLKRYEQRSPSIMELHLAEQLNLTNPLVSSINLPAVGLETISECVRDPAYARVVCRVASRYNSIISVIDIYAPTTMDDKVIEQILSRVLTTVDPRIQEIDVRQ